MPAILTVHSFTFVLLGLGACFSPTYPEGRPCGSAMECPGNLQCVSGACVSAGTPANDRVAVFPDRVDFGSVVVGISSVPLTLEVIALADTGTLAPAIGVGAEHFRISTDGCSGVALIEGQRCRLEVTFEPKVLFSEFAGELVVGNVTAELSGFGLPAGDLSLVPSALTFDDLAQGQSSVEQLVVITNAGASVTDLVVATDSTAGSGAVPFAITTNTCADLNQDESCMVGVVFSPSRVENASATLLVRGTRTDGEQVTAASMSGNGIPGTFELSVDAQGGGGTVVSTPAGINCSVTSGTCREDFPFGEEVSLEPSGGFFGGFLGWAGDCTGSGPCMVTMDSAKSVRANFRDGE